MLALDPLHVLLPDGMLLCIHMAFVGAPAVRVVPCDAKRLQESLQAQKDIILPPAEHIHQDLPGVVINRIPQLSLVRLLAHIGPHFVEIRVQPTMPLKLVCTAYLYLYLLSRDIGQHSLIHLVQLRRLFLSSLMTLVVLTCSTRAVSRIPLAFIAISTI
jgi:hypothetical protein